MNNHLVMEEFRILQIILFEFSLQAVVFILDMLQIFLLSFKRLIYF